MPPIDVLFVCLHGSAKSVIAAEHCRRLAAPRGLGIAVASAGLEPDDQIPANVVEGLASDGIRIDHQKPERLNDFILSRSCVVVAIGCAFTVPPEPMFIRWGDVPAVDDDYGAARNVILAKLTVLLDEIAGKRGLRSTRET
jgi:protein-tyrosine-phosphatase